MKEHEFYRLYSNMPLKNRTVLFDHEEGKWITPQGIYIKLKQIDDHIFNLQKEKERLLDIAGEIMK